MPDDQQITVLLVEDEALIRMDAEDAFEDEGYRVLPAGSADEALAILSRARKVDVLFTDVKMPGPLNGLELARIVHERWPKIKVIVTSGHAALRDEDLPGEGRFFRKPYQPEQVAQTIHHMVVPPPGEG